MAKNVALLSINFIRDATKVAGTGRLSGTRGVSYAAAVAEVDQGFFSSQGSHDAVVECEEERGGQHYEPEVKSTINVRNTEGCDEWVPHPRSGIYYPKGHDWVLEDVSHSAASSSGPTFWLRSVEGVDGPHIDAF